MGAIQTVIEQKLAAELNPTHLEVVNESGMHNVPPGSESHFRVTVVSEVFAGASLVSRHRRVNSALSEELAGGVHALGIHALTPQEWFERYGTLAPSPPCLGGEAARTERDS